MSTENINGALYAYTYDDVGNITGITRGGAQYHSFAYDAQNRLVRDNSYTSGGGTYVWTYDALGNIRTKKTYAYTTGSVDSLTPTKTITYNYGKDGKTGWNYLLTSVDLNGNGTIDNTEKISYDSIGNPTSYLGAVTAWNGRQMIGYAKDGNRYTMTYDADGLRGVKNKSYNVFENGATVTKTEKTTYQYVGDKLYYENRNNGKEFYYFYDNVGHLSAIAYHTGNTVTMFYVSTNMQGDVLSIHLSDGTKIAQYDYDAWGKATIATVSKDSSSNYVYTTVTEATAPNHIATLNPIRYRGYYYDSDLGLYYLQSRYYDANIGRFINADSTNILAPYSGEITDKNLFSYCDSNPVNRQDNGGAVWETVFDLVSLGLSIYDVVKNPKDVWAWVGLIGDTIDLIPFVAGVGETVKVFKASSQIVESADNVIDSAKAIRRSVGKSTGSYEIIFKSNKTYVGKGGFNRAINSAERLSKKHTDEVVSLTWKSAPDTRTAFINEYKSMCKFGGPNNSVIGNKMSYNQIWSPGRKYFYQDYGSYYRYGGKFW